jgi:PAS domain S-box-containing protein
MASSLDLAARLAAVVRTQQEVLDAITDLDKVIALIVDRTPSVTSGDGAVVEMLEGEMLVYRAASGIAKPHIGLRLASAGSLSGLAVREKTLVRCDDTETDPRVDGAACRAIGIRSMLIAPITEGDVAVGALKTFSPRPRTFDDLDVYALQLLAGMASGALAQARVFREQQASEERYRMLFDRNVAGVFRSTLDGRILDCNDALVHSLCYDSREELLALQAWDLYHQRSDREELLRLLQQNRTMLQVRLSLRRKDGSAMLGVINASLVPGDGGETNLLGTIVEA